MFIGFEDEKWCDIRYGRLLNSHKSDTDLYLESLIDCAKRNPKFSGLSKYLRSCLTQEYKRYKKSPSRETATNVVYVLDMIDDVLLFNQPDKYLKI